jgi:hypothetical protein
MGAGLLLVTVQTLKLLDSWWQGVYVMMERGDGWSGGAGHRGKGAVL